jgi:superfamily II DNA/RNA helicase
LRRIGRTGRAGRSGKATIFAYGKQVEAAKLAIKAGIDGKKIEPGISTNKFNSVISNSDDGEDDDNDYDN